MSGEAKYTSASAIESPIRCIEERGSVTGWYLTSLLGEKILLENATIKKYGIGAYK